MSTPAMHGAAALVDIGGQASGWGGWAQPLKACAQAHLSTKLLAVSC